MLITIIVLACVLSFVLGAVAAVFVTIHRLPKILAKLTTQELKDLAALVARERGEK